MRVILLASLMFFVALRAGAHQQPSSVPIEEVGTLGGTGLMIAARCVNISIKTVSSDKPLKIYSNYPAHWRLEGASVMQDTYFLRSNGVLFLESEKNTFVCKNKRLIALPNTQNISDELRKSWDKSTFLATDETLFRDGKPFAKLTPTDLKLENSEPEELIIDLPEGRGGILNLEANKDVQLQMPKWSGSDLAIRASGKSNITLGDVRLSGYALINQSDKSEIKIGKLNCHKLTIDAQDGEVDVLGGGAALGTAGVHAKKQGGTVKLIGGFQAINTKVEGGGSIERK